MTAFEELGLLPQLGEAVSLLAWELPTAIQSDAIPAILGGGDVLIAAETGSGKTGAFSLPVAQIMYEQRKGGAPSAQDGSSKVAQLSLSDRDAGLAIHADGRNCESRAPKAWHGARCTKGVHSSGKYYYEVKVVRDGLCRVGWSTAAATRNLGTDANSFGFGGTGKKSHNARFDDYGQSFTTGDILGCFLDLDEHKIWWSKNGREFACAYELPRSFLLPSNALFPAVLLQTSGLSANFGDLPFEFPPKGFTSVHDAPPETSTWKEVASQVEHDTKAPLCLVLEPTYELVEQTQTNLCHFCSKLSDPSICSLAVVGGGDTRRIMDTLERGVEAVVGTPARVCDMVESEAIATSSLQLLILDEADQLLSSGQTARFVERLLDVIPRFVGTRRLQVICCSATLRNQAINRFAERYMHFPTWIDLKGMDAVGETVHHVACPVDAANDKTWIRIMHSGNHLEDDHVHVPAEIRPGSSCEETLSFGTKVLKGLYVLKAIEALDMKQAMIFCRTKQQCDQMEAYLNRNGHEAVCLHGDRSPDQRKAALSAFKQLTIPFLICTDVAARGLDVRGVPYVINVTLPDDKLNYIHRVGRTGRADRMGLSISLVSSHREKVWYHSCPSRGNHCEDRRDKTRGGCTIWYDEQQLLGEVEEHLGCTIATVDADFRIPTDELDGKVVYGTKRVQGKTFEGFSSRLATAIAQLADMETALQTSYWTLTAS